MTSSPLALTRPAIVPGPRSPHGSGRRGRVLTPAPRRGDPGHPGARGRSGRVRAAFEDAERLPASREARDRLLAALRAGGPWKTDAVVAIERDLGLTLAVLRAANRRGRRPAGGIGTIPEAVEALGDRRLVALAGGVCVFDLVTGGTRPGVPPEHMRTHALAVQAAVDGLARRSGRANLEELLVAGLLHDVGKALLAILHVGYPGEIHGEARTPGERVRSERLALGLDHAVIGAALLRRWRLPDRVVSAVEDHHSPDADGDADLVGLADLLVHHATGEEIGPGDFAIVAERAGVSWAQLRAAMYELPTAATERRCEIEPSPFSARETYVLRGIVGGRVSGQIAADLGLSTSTVRSHLHAICGKLAVPDRAQAVLAASARGWLG